MTYVPRVHLSASAIIPSTDYNQGMDNEAYLKSEHDLATPTALNAGWRQDGFTWTYVSASIFGIAGQSPSLIYQRGTRIRWKDGGAYKYGVSTCSSGSRFSFAAGTDYSASSGATVTDNYYSYESIPLGYPDLFNYSPSFTGFSASPTTFFSQFKVEGHTCTWIYRDTGGTSASEAHTMTLPVRSGSMTNAPIRGSMGYTANAGTGAANGVWEIESSASTLALYQSAMAAWTTSGVSVQTFVAQWPI